MIAIFSKLKVNLKTTLLLYRPCRIPLDLNFDLYPQYKTSKHSKTLKNTHPSLSV